MKNNFWALFLALGLLLFGVSGFGFVTENDYGKEPIITLAELFQQIEARAKAEPNIYPVAVCISNYAHSYHGHSPIGNYYHKYGIFVNEDNSNLNNIGAVYSDNRFEYFVHGGEKEWVFTVDKTLILNSVYDKIMRPVLCSRGSTKKFQQFYKELILLPKGETAVNRDCYKLLATTYKNNFLEREYTEIFWIDKEILKIIQLKSAVKVQEILYNLQDKYVFKENKKNYWSVIEQYRRLIPFDKKYSIIDESFYTEKEVHNVPFKMKLLEPPENDEDYKDLEKYFNMLIKAYFNFVKPINLN